MAQGGSHLRCGAVTTKPHLHHPRIDIADPLLMIRDLSHTSVNFD